jgi:dienelactone hydrolase
VIRPRRLALLGIALVAVLPSVACSGDGADGTTATTLDPVAAARAYVAPGPHPVGVATLELPDTSVEVWYPAVAGTEGTVAYDVRDFVPDAVRGILTGDAPATYEIDGARDAPIADGEFPAVLYSHGFTGFRTVSSFLTSHLASWGMVVIAPDHPSRDLRNVLGGTASGELEDSLDDLAAALDLVADDADYGAHVDLDHVAAVGHSAGGGTVLLAGADGRIDGYVAMASGRRDDTVELPDMPSYFLGGSLDEVVPVSRSRAAFEQAPPPSLLWEIDAVGHNGFDDLCTFGGGTGIIGVAEASGLGAFLDAQPDLRDLGEDGCVEPAAPIEDAHELIRQGVTAWLLELFGEVDDPAGLTELPDGAFALDVTIEVAA